MPVTGPSAEMRRFSAGIRLVTALLCTVLLLIIEVQMAGTALMILLAYGMWSAWLLWREATGQAHRAPVWHYWIDVAWALATMKFVAAGTPMLTVTLVHPVVLASIGFGVPHGLLLALFAAGGLVSEVRGDLMQAVPTDWRHTAPALMVLALVPAAALISRPMSLLRRRLALIDAFEANLDPRRGLEPVCAELVEKLCASTDADVVALVLPSALGSPAVLAARGEGGFRARDDVHARLESLLAGAPDCPVSFIGRRLWDPRRRLRLHAAIDAAPTLAPMLAALAKELEVRSLHVVPLTRYGQRHGHFIVGYPRAGGNDWDASALATSAPELLRVIEQATLVDQLQEESASHERARIGRDLHDSAIQPYLGLKYAVECVALRIAADNPARVEIDALAELVNGEVSGLRELISGLRTGGARGDDALVPAVRRQVRRFALLFGMDISIDCPDQLPTTRALASAIFHIVNETLNNVRQHTGARQVTIGLAADGNDIRLTVRDDAGTRRGAPLPTFKPRSLSERVAELGGTLAMSLPDGLNNELVIRIPTDAPRSPSRVSSP